MSAIDSETLDHLSLTEIERVRFYKRDEITTDLICCDVEMGEKVWTFHEENEGWELLLQHLYKLPGFKTDWYAAVAQPPFSESETIAFRRAQQVRLPPLRTWRSV